MKLTSILLFGTLASAQAAVYTMNLGTAPYRSPIDGVDGWVQSEANYVDGEVYPRSFVHEIGSSRALALGGYYDSEAPSGLGPGVSVSRQLISLGLNHSTLALDFTIQDSITSYPDSFPGDVDRNRFSIGFFDNSGDELINLIFSPNSQSTDPSNATATWNMFVSSNGVGAAAFGAVFEGSPSLGGVYSLSLTTVPSATAGAVDYNLSVFSAENTFNTSGTLAGLAGAQIDRLKVGWEEAGTEVDGLGSNFIALKGVVVAVPEPSGLALCLISSLPLFIRRRRARL